MSLDWDVVKASGVSYPTNSRIDCVLPVCKEAVVFLMAEDCLFFKV